MGELVHRMWVRVPLSPRRGEAVDLDTPPRRRGAARESLGVLPATPDPAIREPLTATNAWVTLRLLITHQEPFLTISSLIKTDENTVPIW